MNPLRRNIASISLDLDNLWSYMKTHGDAGWESYPSYLDTLVPRALELLDEVGINITFFIVGQDAALDKNREALAQITRRGHDIGNHSFNHEVWLHAYARDAMRDELARAAEAIEAAMGQKPVGFRGPGFVWSPDLLRVLADMGYLYDASLLPTYIGPLARMYYFWKADLTAEEKAKRGKIYSSFKEGLRPVKPYFWRMGNGHRLLEIPVTTMPVFKTPFHLSYLVYLCRYSKLLMRLYLNIAVTLCRMTGTSPSFLLHPLDFIGSDTVPQLEFFPGMELDGAAKADIFRSVIRTLQRHFDLVDMSTHAQHAIDAGGIATRTLN